VKIAFIGKTLVASLGLLALFAPQRADAQIIPQPWVSVGAKDGDVTYAVGAKALNYGAELGVGEDGAVGVDILQFLPLPKISPYVGVGYYTENQGVSVSGGVQVNPTKNLMVGAGYNSRRGFNGQLGIRF
jgi:opacity protein-like surface antigen